MTAICEQVTLAVSKVLTGLAPAAEAPDKGKGPAKIKPLTKAQKHYLTLMPELIKVLLIKDPKSKEGRRYYDEYGDLSSYASEILDQIPAPDQKEFGHISQPVNDVDDCRYDFFFRHLRKECQKMTEEEWFNKWVPKYEYALKRIEKDEHLKHVIWYANILITTQEDLKLQD
jgi:hypothetical protein